MSDRFDEKIGSKQIQIGKEVRLMAANEKLEELRQAVLGNGRGREVEVTPDGQVHADSSVNHAADNPQDQESMNPKPSKMSKVTWGI